MARFQSIHHTYQIKHKNLQSYFRSFIYLRIRCKKKKKYTDESKVKAEAKRLDRILGGMYYYKCSNCNTFHLTKYAY